MIEKSLMNLDIQRQITTSKKNLSELNEEKNTIFYTIQKNEFNIIEFCKNYDTMIEKAEFSKNKQKKKLNREIKIMEESPNFKYYNVYQNLKKINQTIKQEQDTLNYAENYIKDQIHIIYNILKENHYIDEKNNITRNTMSCIY